VSGRHYWRPERHALSVLLGAFVALVSASGCTVSGTAVSEGPAASHSASRAPEVRQRDDAGRLLPFKTVFPNRWSQNNDGTTYEPCTYVTEPVLMKMGLDPKSAKDAAVADHQTVRGCDWRFTNSESSSLSQSVGNLAGAGVADLDGYKAEFDDFRWFPDQLVDGRTVATFSLGTDHCATLIVSGRALVMTAVWLGQHDPDVSENCGLAFAFTRATINKIPR